MPEYTEYQCIFMCIIISYEQVKIGKTYRCKQYVYFRGLMLPTLDQESCALHAIKFVATSILIPNKKLVCRSNFFTREMNKL